MDLVDEREPAVGAGAELVLGVDQQQPCRRRDVAAPLEDRQRGGADLVPAVGVHMALRDDLGLAEGSVVAGCGLGGGGDDRAGQGVVLGHPVGEVDAVDTPLAGLVAGPQRRGGGAGQAAPHHDLHRQGLALVDDGDVGVGHGHDLRRRDVAELLEPPGRQQVEDLAPPRYQPQHVVEGRQAVGGHQRQTVAQFDDVAHLAPVQRPQLGRSRVGEPGERVDHRCRDHRTVTPG